MIIVESFSFIIENEIEGWRHSLKKNCFESISKNDFESKTRENNILSKIVSLPNKILSHSGNPDFRNREMFIIEIFKFNF